MVKIHLIKKVMEPEFGFGNYILFCGIGYKDSDNINMTYNIKKATCKKCLKNEKIKTKC